VQPVRALDRKGYARLIMRLPSKRMAAAAAAVIAVYAAFGFAGVPWLVKRELAAYASDHLQRRATVGEVRFNPFTLHLQARDVLLAEADGAPIFGAGRLAVEMQWRSLATLAWRFAAIELEAPVASLHIAPDGRFNIAELVAAARRGGEPARDDSLPRVVIERFAVTGGRVDMQDRRAGYANTLAPIDFELTGFSTLPDQKDEYRFVARSKRGAVLRWKGQSSVNPIRAEGEFAIEDASLPEFSVYLRSQVHATIAAGKLSATLPYSVSYADGRLEARVTGAGFAARDLAFAREGASDSFASLTQLRASGIDADLVRREFSVAEVRAERGRLALRRDAKGQLDLASLMVQSAGPAAAPPAGAAVQAGDWKAAIAKIVVDGVALNAVDETVEPALRLDIGSVGAQLALKAAQKDGTLQLQMGDAALALADVALARGSQPAQTLARFGFDGGALDLAARRVSVDTVNAEGAQLHVTRDKSGAIDVAHWVSRGGAPAAAGGAQAGAAPWSASAGAIEASKIAVEFSDEQSGMSLHVVDGHAQLAGVATGGRQPVKFDAGFALREGGQVAAQGSVVLASGAVQAQVKARTLALAPLQPLLAQYLKLRIAGGALSAQGHIATGSGNAGAPQLRYDGGFSIDGLAIRELDDAPFASWKSLGAARLTASVAPNRLEIPELRLVGADAKLIVENDRSFNAVRLLVKHEAPVAGAAAAPGAAIDAEPFPVRVRRLRIEDAKLDFTDLSLRPQFAAKIHELAGAVNGLSTSRTARAQIELDGRVDEFGQARIRGETSLAAPRDSTDVNFVFRNVDMVPASPYSMKFAGYRIAEGRISLDLQYRIRDSKLQGDNRIVIDRLTLGERVDSPDAMNLPLELAVAILKDSDGRIDLGLPVSGDLDDPQFSYGALVWKAITNVITKIVTAPFRAIGALLGSDGAKLEAIDFDAGSGKLQPPEREKLKQVAQILAKREALKLSIPGQYSPTADGAALRALAVRRDVAQRAGIQLASGEEAGPLDLGDRSVRNALRALYAQRFGDAELDKAKQAAESAPAAEPVASATPASRQSLPLWQRAAKMIQGEPQVADASAFYRQLRERLERERALPPQALAELGAERAKVIADALAQGGVDAARFTVAPPSAADSPAGPVVGVKLGLAAR
jgi:hypothetical protein